MKIPELVKSSRDREYKLYSEESRILIVYQYLFLGKQHRNLDKDVLNLDPSKSKGYQSMGVLHFLGMKKDFRGLFMGISIEDGINLLKAEDRIKYSKIISMLETYKNQENLINKSTGLSEDYKIEMLINASGNSFIRPNLSELEVEELKSLCSFEKKKEKKSAKKVQIKSEIKKMISNKKLGDSGEDLVLDYFLEVKKEIDEVYKLALVDMVSKTNDTCGYDILITEIDHQEPMYIEVKTTEGNWDTPFFMSENEIEFAKQHPDRYFIYRVYDTKNTAKIKVICFNQIPEDAIKPNKYSIQLKK